MKARYSKHFAIDAEALQWLGDRDRRPPRPWSKTACQDHLAKLKRAAGMG